MLLLLSLLPSGPAIKATESQDQRDSIFWKKEKLGARASSRPPRPAASCLWDTLGHIKKTMTYAAGGPTTKPLELPDRHYGAFEQQVFRDRVPGGKSS